MSINYVNLLERGENAPALDIFIDIVKALSVTSDIILTDVLDTGYHPKAHSFLNGLPPRPRRIIGTFFLL